MARTHCVDRILEGRGIKPLWLAEKLQISRAYMSRLLSEERPWTDELKDKAAHYLMIPRDVLFFESQCSPELQSSQQQHTIDTEPEP